MCMSDDFHVTFIVRLVNLSRMDCYDIMWVFIFVCKVNIGLPLNHVTLFWQHSAIFN